MYALSISALLYLGAFVYPDYLYAAVFIWLVPLITTDTHNRYGLRAGYTWGLLFFGGHLAWLACIAPWYFYVLVVAYFALYAGFWLWMKQRLSGYVSILQNQNRKWAALCCTWVISTATFMYLTCYCSLAICGCLEGYPFINPLLPLISLPAPIFYISTLFSWFAIIVCNLIAASVYNGSIGNAIKLSCLLLLCWSMVSIFDVKKNVKKVIKKSDLVFVQPTWCTSDQTPAQTFYDIARKLDQIALSSPQAKYIVMPESAFPYNLMAFADRFEAWTSLFDPALQFLSDDDVTIFIGGHYHDEHNHIFNSLYQISDGKIVGRYDKQHLVPFVERMPWFVQWIPILKNVFQDQSCWFSYPTEDQSDIVMEGFKPCICSELFFTCPPPCPPKLHAKAGEPWRRRKQNRIACSDNPILFMCNDSWFKLKYIRDLAKRCVQLYALQHDVDIIYVGHYDMVHLQRDSSITSV